MRVPNISDAEWDVMRIVWIQSPLTSAEIIEQLSSSKTWNPKTIRTLISRLVQKEALGCNKDSKEYKYFPLVEEGACVKAESLSFLNRIFGGSLKPMMAHFIENEKLTPEDIQELKAMIKEKEQK